MEILRSGKTLFVEVVCAAGFDEDDEDIVYCDCPFFRFDEGERACLAMKDPHDMDELKSEYQVGDACPLTKYRATIKLKTVFSGVECAGCVKEGDPERCPAQGPDGTYPPPGGFERCFESERRKLTIQELAERVNIEAAQEALRGLKSKVSSLGFAPPEAFMLHMADIVELMNDLATALVMQEVKEEEHGEADTEDGGPTAGG